ncbi:MAG: excinuclease ABC subunit UvrC, partial [Deltaproteobacteria bacterium]|nr:excinuclease ABC subunit UvrC [Deltaproteobacteria bacterium]
MALSADELKELARTLPHRPGVYLMEDAKARVIYVGKAKDLRKRVASHFQEGRDQGPRHRAMIGHTARVDFLVAGSEKEALILEATLIKRHRPRYNIDLIDDKAYPFIRLSIGDEYPKLVIVRRIRRDGHRYFGPYVSSGSARATLKLMHRIFPLRQCRGSKPPPRSRPCLHHQMGHCLAPCCLEVDPEEYQGWVDEAVLFLTGRTSEVQKRLKKAMREAAQEERFEEAAGLRDKLAAIEATLEKQVMVSTRLIDRDVFGFAAGPTGLAAAVLFVRGGALTGSRTFFLRGVEAAGAEVIGQALSQFYIGKAALVAEGQGRGQRTGGHKTAILPQEILLPDRPAASELIACWLSEARGSKVVLRAPKRGEGRDLVARAQTNAESALPLLSGSPEALAGEGLAELGRRLGLAASPESLEAFDISTLQGSHSRGAMVRFEEGRPVRSKYRDYRIKTVSSQDDYAMLAEVLRRRFGRASPSLSRPDLVIIDGGKGQLAAAQAALAELGLADQPLAALAKTPGAKDADRLFIPGRKNPLPLSKPARFLLMSLRDEAHRRAIRAHRRGRAKSQTHSRLLEIEGVGPKRAQILLKRFGSLAGVRRASVEELAQAPGLSPA